MKSKATNTKKVKTETIPNLDQVVINALNFFDKEMPKFPKKIFSGIAFIVGSGNAYNAARVIFGDKAAIFASESNFKRIIRDYQPIINKAIIKEALIISASGEKDSVWELELAKKHGLKTILFTCSPDSSAAKLADKVFVFNKLKEPYTYNTSTYLAMILGATQESPKKILKAIKNLRFPRNFANYKAYSFILPDALADIAPMLEIKRHELFGPHLSIRAFSEGEARHAKFVNPWNKELVISLADNKFFGYKENRWEIKNVKFEAALTMALCYFIIGKIQEAKKPYFRNNIAKYCLEGPKAYGKKSAFSVIVD